MSGLPKQPSLPADHGDSSTASLVSFASTVGRFSGRNSQHSEPPPREFPLRLVCHARPCPPVAARQRCRRVCSLIQRKDDGDGVGERTRATAVATEFLRSRLTHGRNSGGGCALPLGKSGSGRPGGGPENVSMVRVRGVARMASAIREGMNPSPTVSGPVHRLESIWSRSGSQTKKPPGVANPGGSPLLSVRLVSADYYQLQNRPVANL